MHTAPLGRSPDKKCMAEGRVLAVSSVGLPLATEFLYSLAAAADSFADLRTRVFQVSIIDRGPEALQESPQFPPLG